MTRIVAMTSSKAQRSGPRKSGRRDAKRHQKKIKFFESAKPLFLRFGFRKTTVEDICREAGASKRTFYELFRDKGDLLMQLCVSVADGMAATWKERVIGNDSALFRFEAFLDEYTRISKEERIFKVLVSEPSLFTTGVSDESRIQMMPVLGLLQEILEHGVETGEFRRMDTERAAWIIFSVLDSVHFIMPEFGNIPGPLEDDSFAAELRAFLLGSVMQKRDRDRKGRNR
jgi:AcrR family transcriptional regulator